jgi:hypothetical protein
MKYSDFQPTGFDPKGLGCEDEQDWRVVPCGQNRDSGILQRANFISALKILGGESADVQVNRFGHWANGWFEIILVNPAREDLIKEVDEIEGCLENYPVLDDSLYSEMEYEAHCEWADQEIQRIANDRDIELDDESYCSGNVIQHFDTWYYDEYSSGSQPSDDDIALYLVESKMGKPTSH